MSVRKKKHGKKRPKQRIFAYDGFRVSVTTDSARDLDWLAEFLAPQFRVQSSGRPHCTVGLTKDRDQFAKLKRRGRHPGGSSVESYFLDTKIVRYPVWRSAKGSTVVHDDDLDVFYRLDETRRSVEVVARNWYPLARLALMRVVREFAMNHVHRDDTLVIHGAALTYGKSCLLIPGHKGAGKTSLLVHALMQKGGRYVSNDRAVLYDGKDGFVAHGMPTLVKLRHSSLKLFPELYERLKASAHYPALSLEESEQRPWGDIRAWRQGQYTLSPAQLCDLLHVPSRARGSIGAVLFPRVSDGVKGVRLERLTRPRAAEQVEASLFRARFARKYGGVFSTRNGSNAPTDADAARFARRLVSQVPCYVCHLELGENTQRTLPEELEKNL